MGYSLADWIGLEVPVFSGINQTDNAELSVTTAGQQGSGILSSMIRANCFIVLGEEQGDIKAGSVVPVQPFECFA